MFFSTVVLMRQRHTGPVWIILNLALAFGWNDCGVSTSQAVGSCLLVRTPDGNSLILFLGPVAREWRSVLIIIKVRSNSWNGKKDENCIFFPLVLAYRFLHAHPLPPPPLSAVVRCAVLERGRPGRLTETLGASRESLLTGWMGVGEDVTVAPN